MSDLPTPTPEPTEERSHLDPEIEEEEDYEDEEEEDYEDEEGED